MNSHLDYSRPRGDGVLNEVIGASPTFRRAAPLSLSQARKEISEFYLGALAGLFSFAYVIPARETVGS
jgi:hypothetical protein